MFQPCEIPEVVKKETKMLCITRDIYARGGKCKCVQERSVNVIHVCACYNVREFKRENEENPCKIRKSHANPRG